MSLFLIDASPGMLDWLSFFSSLHQVCLPQVLSSLLLAIPLLQLGWHESKRIGQKAMLNDLIWNTFGSISSSGNWLEQKLKVVICKLVRFGTKCRRSAVSMERKGLCVFSNWFCQTFLFALLEVTMTREQIMLTRGQFQN